MKIELNSLEKTENFGKKLGSLLDSGDILCMDGDLGAGKTTMTKSIGLGLGVEEYITSPTFALVNIYSGRLMVYHFDVYRLEDPEEIYELGFDEYFYGDGVSIIEWAEKIKSILPEERIELYIYQGKDQNSRIVEIKGSGDAYKRVIEGMK